MEKKKYNLRSTKADTRYITLQLHLADDNNFVNEKSAMSHQDSDLSLSGSDLDCNAIIQYDSCYNIKQQVL